ncbi:MAG: Arc family DNA-binding protein [Candidatus Riflebacteria bacterium]|nr:Arc family DNA-binding protein [Candidatus Riflebacteria bacterium]
MSTKKSFLIRIDPVLYDAIQRWADDEFRSINSHIEFLLRETLKKNGRLLAKQDEKKETDNKIPPTTD